MTPGDCTGTLALTSPDVWDWPELHVVKRTLPNGLRVLLAENHATPFVWLGWVSPAGSGRDDAERAGLAALVPLLLREGTLTRDARRITADVEDLGAYLAAGCDWDSAFLSLELLACDLPRGAELLVDLACRPRVANESVLRLRQRRLAELERRERQPGALADDTLARALYGDSPYGRSPLGTPASLRRIEAADAAAFHASHYRPGASYLVLVGSFDGDAATELLAGIALPHERVPDAAAVGSGSFAPAAAAAPGVHLVDAPRAGPVELRLGQAGVARDHPDLPGLHVLAALLGGGPCSRLAESLRQRLGLTYSVRSRFVARDGGGPFVVETRVAGDAAARARDAITREIERLREERVPADELRQVQRRLLGLELRRFQYSFDVGGALAQAAFEAEAERHFERKRRAIAAVEPDSLRELARRHLRPERLVTVAVGPAETLRRQFASHAVVEPPGRPARSDIVGGESPRT